MILESAQLYYKSGASDKEYQVYLEEVSPGHYRTHTRYGRTGNANQSASKYDGPNYYPAKRAFDAIVQEKKGKGYQGSVTTHGAAGSASSGTSPVIAPVTQQNASGHIPHLLQPIDEDEAQQLIASSSWWMQQKMDGDRLAILTDNASGINRKGLFKPLHPDIESDVRKLPPGTLLDGEVIGETFHAFDLLEENGVSIRSDPYAKRYERLTACINTLALEHIKLVATAFTPEEKAHFYKVLVDANVEGVVFKDPTSAYQNGMRNSSQKKWKFWKSATVMVGVVNEKRSVEMWVYQADGSGPISIGNCSIPVNREVPAVGDLIEVKYLYAYPGGDLIQPQYLGTRTDVDDSDANIEQLIYKAGA